MPGCHTIAGVSSTATCMPPEIYYHGERPKSSPSRDKTRDSPTDTAQSRVAQRRAKPNPKPKTQNQHKGLKTGLNHFGRGAEQARAPVNDMVHGWPLSHGLCRGGARGAQRCPVLAQRVPVSVRRVRRDASLWPDTDTWSCPALI
jgi:hypothetical protein